MSQEQVFAGWDRYGNRLTPTACRGSYWTEVAEPEPGGIGIAMFRRGEVRFDIVCAGHSVILQHSRPECRIGCTRSGTGAGMRRRLQSDCCLRSSVEP